MPSFEDPGLSREEVGARAREAVRLGSSLDADHRADPGALRSIGNCRLCGILSYQVNDGSWKHVPAIEECAQVDDWIRRHRQMTSLTGNPADAGYR
jgi:hypothetical protein